MSPITNPQPQNYSLYAIPAYYLLAMIPHIYSSTLLKVSQPKGPPSQKDPTSNSASKSKSKSTAKPGSSLYNLANPRSTSNSETYSSHLDRSTYQKYERARAAHANLLESSSFVISAILAGIVTKLPASYMNTTTSLYLLTRVAYCFAYIRTEKGLWAVGRTVWFMAGNLVLCAIWAKAGQRVMRGEY